VILDTNALSALADGEPGVAQILAHADHVYMSVVVLGEYRFGLLQSTARAAREAWLNSILHSTSVLVIDDETAHRYASLRLDQKRKGRTIPVNDLWIAAQATQHHLPILSNDAHFDVVDGLTRLDWT
jgi:tRNA(fMet)-specific endonuclease VapC